jgi:hypothetical protein
VRHLLGNRAAMNLLFNGFSKGKNRVRPVFNSQDLHFHI